MRPETKIALNDALAAAEEVIEIGSTGLDDRITGLAVERLLLIVGEAMVRVRDLESQVLDSIPDWQLIVGMRNVIVHGYDQLDRRRLAAAISEDLPILISNLRQLID
ncbi:MAG: DUF86 domain-containing protein [Chthonomonas sp.]|nr:DUF86 domain-containing protein [Chthonomonas sp.]